MPEWREMQRHDIDGLTVIVKERWDRRNYQGGTEYFITVQRNEQTVHFERHPWNVWAGHCAGKLLIPIIVENAKRREALAVQST